MTSSNKKNRYKDASVPTSNTMSGDENAYKRNHDDENRRKKKDESR